MPSMTTTIAATAASIAATPASILVRSSSVSDGARPHGTRQQVGAAANGGQGRSQVVPEPIEEIERALGVGVVVCTHQGLAAMAKPRHSTAHARSGPWTRVGKWSDGQTERRREESEVGGRRSES